MMTREQFIQRLEEIESLKIQSKQRQHEECRAVDDERIRVQHALTDARNSYLLKYREEMAAAQNRCSDTCQAIRRREHDLQLQLTTERLQLEAQWDEQNKGAVYTLPAGERPNQEGGAA